MKFELCGCPCGIPHVLLRGIANGEDHPIYSKASAKEVLFELFMSNAITATQMADLANSEALKTLPEVWPVFLEDEEE